MNPARLIADLNALGVVLTVRYGELRARGLAAELSPEVVRVITTFKAPILAAVNGRPVPSSEPGVVWDPQGGVRSEELADLRSLALSRAAELLRPFPRMDLELSGDSVEPGRKAWWAFCGTAPLDAVAEALLLMDDPHAVEAAEIRAISLLF